ncbi:hypothetical protein MICRO8M_70305 [Microbacterium sp. 8M]|nr:hypothetical protein MICRO8M_70305 [Microbacterium sp. 8M]
MIQDPWGLDGEVPTRGGDHGRSIHAHGSGTRRAVSHDGADPHLRGGDPARVPRGQVARLRHRRGPGARRDAPVCGAGARGRRHRRAPQRR